MSDFDEIRDMLVELAQAANFLAVQAFAEQQAFLVTFREDIGVGLELDSDRGVIVLSAELGQPMLRDVERLYRLALQFGHIWYSTDGSHIGVDPDSGEMVLFAQLGIEPKNADRLAFAVLGFIERLQAWRALVAGKTEGQVPPDSEPRDNIIRV